MAKYQQDTINALKERIEALEKKNVDLERENLLQKHTMETIISALKLKGLIITIDGDMVTIADKGRMTSHRKRITTTQETTVTNKDEDKI